MTKLSDDNAPRSEKNDLCNMSATALTNAYERKTVSPVDVVEAVLERAEKLNPTINAIYYIDADGAREQARASEARWQAGKPSGLLDGVPVSIKDSIAVRGIPMLRGMEAYRGSPAPEADAPPTARLREHGAVIFGKTTMPDLGLLGAGVSSAYGVTRNPWNTDYNSGGSSAGSSAAVAARIGPLTVGTDLGGSVRLPAGFCGLSTIKPTQGIVPHLPPSATRSAGPIARDITDTALMLTVLAGSDPYDFGSYPSSGIQFHQQLNADMRGWKIGVLDSIGGKDAVEPVILETLRSAASLFEKAGASVSTIPQVIDFDFIEDLRVIFGSRSLTDVNKLPAEKRALIHPVVQETVARAGGITATQFIKSLDAIELAKKKVVAATYPFDVVIAPVSPVVNFAAEDVGPVAGDFCSFIHFTAMFNQTGQPATATFAALDDRGLPIGLQFIGKRFDDLRTLQAAAFFERERGGEIPWPL